MKKILILGVSVFAFACNSSSNNSAGEDVEGDINSKEHVEDYTHENRSPQLKEQNSSGTRFEVDTIRSAESAQEQAKDKSLD